jgi:hypothetical protein
LEVAVCRNIVPLFNFDPPATDEEIHAAALQFVRKVSGFRQPSQANRAAFDCAVEEISNSLRTLLNGLSTGQPPQTREEAAAKRQARTTRRFGQPTSAGSPK